MKEDASYLASLQPPESGMASVQGSRLDLKRGWSQLPMMTSTLQLRIVTGYRPTAASFDNSILVLGWPSNFTSFVQRAVSNAKGEGTLYILAPMKPADLEKIEAERPSTANLFLNIVPGNPRSVADLQRAGVMFVKRCIVLNHGLERVGHPSKDYLATEVYSLVMKLRRDDPNFFCSVSLVNVRLGCVSYQNHCLPIVSAVTQFDTPTVMPSGSIQAVMSGRGLTDSLMFGAVTRHLALGDVDCLSLSRFLQSDRVAVIPLWKYIVHQSFSELFQFFIDECIGIPFALDCCVDNERLLVVGPPDDFEITGDMQTVVAKFVSEEMVDV
ncbi:MAG: uncharacterized protein KVP18_002836 [Porospora cf. gigantea A]|uniref:uncharacterized protein n=1 Tax=Porospora cf. gigantea A TaxID=2853593 RepID=UPI003559C19A|nr:MAG: hypothetical protein KVP18_002836 [Porospora cf. gigantea A]